MLNGLGLFEGISGITLGLEWPGLCTPMCFVEKNPYAQETLKLRYPEVPIWDDVTTFDGKPWKGKIDIISGGFPCQDISVAGKRAGIKGGNRSGLWSEFKRIISEIRPLFALIENVPALVGWFDIEGRTALPEIDIQTGRERIGEEIRMDVIQEQGIAICIRDLASIGYNAERCIISAADMGAPHLRKRIFIVSYPQCYGRPGSEIRGGIEKTIREQQDGTDGAFNTERTDCISKTRGNVADSKSKNDGISETGKMQRQIQQSGKCDIKTDLADTESKSGAPGNNRREQRETCKSKQSKFGGSDSGGMWGSNWTTEPNLGRVAHGVPSRVDRLKCLGNAVVPQCAEYIGRLIMRAING